MLNKALKNVQFLIPILTPSNFASPACRREAREFLRYEEKAGRGNLILPIYMLETPILEELDQRAQDTLA